tara:strand:- start:303 stop:455 length:153 start_codon:yes stop_codon:yes gene_type:complete
MVAERDPQKLDYFKDLKDRIWQLILKDGHKLNPESKFYTVMIYSEALEYD